MTMNLQRAAHPTRLCVHAHESNWLSNVRRHWSQAGLLTKLIQINISLY